MAEEQVVVVVVEIDQQVQEQSKWIQTNTLV
jgi:hypothetical protein